jgi:hypothetical protein
VRACAWCGGSLEGKRSPARYCSASCRSAARHRHSEETVQKRAQTGLVPVPRMRTFAQDVELARSLGGSRTEPSASRASRRPNRCQPFFDTT